MGITHELDILIVSENLSLKNVELLKGDSYGCLINIKVNGQKTFDFMFILRPDWTEVQKVKSIKMLNNGFPVEMKVIKSSLFEVVYQASFTTCFNTTLEIFSDNFKQFKEKYPIVNINTIKREYEIVNSGMTCINLDSPICDEDRIKYTKYDYSFIGDSYNEIDYYATDNEEDSDEDFEDDTDIEDDTDDDGYSDEEDDN
ncbi:host range protein [Moosepox virus GoldyGopher14]|nr:host range protein [Moosepox virus GoldyGopher14]